MNARLEAQARELTAKAQLAEKRGDRTAWVALHKAWCAIMAVRLGRS